MSAAACNSSFIEFQVYIKGAKSFSDEIFLIYELGSEWDRVGSIGGN
jgi:hypothetical protein